MIEIRHAAPDDVPELVQLLEELERFYGTTQFPDAAVRAGQVTSVLFGDLQPTVKALLAIESSTPVGMASYSFLWPAAGVTRSLYLKELYVAMAHRRRGIGRLLMAALSTIAVEHDCSRLEWTTDEANADAQAFYQGLEVSPHPSKIMYRVDGTALAQLADRSQPTKGA